MERDVRYLLVGIVVAALVAAFVGFVLWQAERYAGVTGNRYTVRVEGDVAGLGTGSVVRYLGVRVGQVHDIRLAREHPGRVEVDIGIGAEVPISRTTVARIKPQGISGQSYVSLRTPDPTAQPPRRPEGARYPVIPAEPSKLDRLLREVPQLVERLGALTEDARAVLAPENRRRIAAILADAQRFTGRLDGLADSLEGVTDRAGRTLAGADAALGEIEGAAASVEPALADARETARSLRDLTDRVDRLIARNEGAFDRFAREGLVELERLLRDARRAVGEIERLGARLNRRPSDLIHRQPSGGIQVRR